MAKRRSTSFTLLLNGGDAGDPIVHTYESLLLCAPSSNGSDRGILWASPQKLQTSCRMRSDRQRNAIAARRRSFAW